MIRQSPIQALPGQNADFDFRHVEPAGVLGRVLKLNPPQKAVLGTMPRNVVETFARMDVQVVQDLMNSLGASMDVFEQVGDKLDEIRLGPTLRHRYQPLPALGLDGDEQIGRGVADIFEISVGGLAG